MCVIASCICNDAVVDRCHYDIRQQLRCALALRWVAGVAERSSTSCMKRKRPHHHTPIPIYDASPNLSFSTHGSDLVWSKVAIEQTTCLRQHREGWTGTPNVGSGREVGFASSMCNDAKIDRCGPC